VITGVTVLPMDDGPALPEMTVIVRGGTIAAIGRAGELPPPVDAKIIDGAGKFLLPGLCDMHVHIVATRLSGGDAPLDDDATMARFREYAAVFLAHGVTTVRNMAGTPHHLRLRAEVAEGRTLGPRIFTSGPILETRFSWPGLIGIGALVTSPEQAREMVRSNFRDGYDFIKIYNDIDADIYDALVRTSREVGLKIIGHVPFVAGLAGALRVKQDSIEHLRSYDFAVDTRAEPDGARFEGWLHTTPERMAELAARTAEAGIWNCPTLVTHEDLEPDSLKLSADGASRAPEWLRTMLASDTTNVRAFTERQRKALEDGVPARRAMVGALDRAGAKLMPGSDCPANGLVPGDSLLRELELFVASGMSPARALRTATIDSAEFLGVEVEQGTVAVGKRADLLLLNANPLERISAIRDQAGVVAAGRYLPR
jgi:imidazolonepropionase-like amidohydrolase